MTPRTGPPRLPDPGQTAPADPEDPVTPPSAPAPSALPPGARIRLLTVVVTTTLVAALAAALISQVSGPRYAAGALLQVTAAGEGSGSSDAVQTAVQTELLLLDSADLASTLGEDGADVDLSATQVANTPVIELLATGPTAATAERAADAAVQAYAERRSADLRTAAQTRADDLQARLQSIADQIDAVGAGPLADAQRQVLVDQYRGLAQQLAEATASAAQAPRPVTLLVSATERGAERASSVLRDTAVGALLGAVLGVAVALALLRGPLLRGPLLRGRGSRAAA